jgi:hypothetical protein
MVMDGMALSVARVDVALLATIEEASWAMRPSMLYLMTRGENWRQESKNRMFAM